jgi:hypothetical protein
MDVQQVGSGAHDVRARLPSGFGELTSSGCLTINWLRRNPPLYRTSGGLALC